MSDWSDWLGSLDPVLRAEVTLTIYEILLRRLLEWDDILWLPEVLRDRDVSWVTIDEDGQRVERGPWLRELANRVLTGDDLRDALEAIESLEQGVPLDQEQRDQIERAISRLPQRPAGGPAAETEGTAAGDAFECRLFIPEDKVAEREQAGARGALAAAAVLQGGPGAKPAKQSPRKTKRSTERGEAKAKLVAALTHHHRYADGGCLNFEPVGCNELARRAGVSNATASRFFGEQFGGHVSYRRACGNETELRAALMLLNDDFPPRYLLNREPTDDSVADDDG